MQPPELYRTRLRAATAEILGDLDAFDGHVFNMRSPPMRRNLLPAVRIFNFQDNRSNASTFHDTGDFEGRLTLRIQVIVEDNSDPHVSDRLDWLCWLVETALLSDPRFRRDLRRVESIDTSIDLDVAGELRMATASMDFLVHYADCIELVIPDELKRIRFRLDFIDPPADPNTGPPGTPPNVEGGYRGGFPGPDGRIENEFEVPPRDVQETNDRAAEVSGEGQR